MAKAVREDLAWQDVDTETFKGGLAKAHKVYKDAAAAAREAREAFEAAFRKEAAKKFGPGKSCLISHKFGKLAIAIVDANDVEKEKVRRSVEKFAL